MKDKLTRLRRRMLSVLLVGSLVAVLVVPGAVSSEVPVGANPVRSLPDQVRPGDEFEVTVTFTSPDDRFHAVGLTDFAPAGWTVTVNLAWVSPPPMDAHTPQPEEAVYIWSGPYAAGTEFTAMYKVQVPFDADPGTYLLPGGELEYYLETYPEDSYIESITGDDEVQVLVEYDLTIDSTGGGSVTTPGEGTFDYDSGDVVDLVAEADECYEFTGWTGDIGYIDDPTSATTTITMNADYSITANFAIIKYDLNIDSTEGGSVTTPGEGEFDYDCGDVVDLVAVAEEGYRFTGWTGDTGGIADPSSATTTVTMNDDYTITANFAIIEYDLTIDSTEGGSVTTPGEGTFDYDSGDVVDLVAEADECYEFTGWTGDIGDIDDPTSATTTITMNSDYTITANFAIIEYDLTIDSTEGGSVTTPGEGTFDYDCGAVIDLVAVADACYEFTGWTGDIGDIDDPTSAATTITMNADYTITANFAIIEYDLTIDSTEGGSVTTPGEGTFNYDCGDVVDLVAVSEEGYRFAGWTGDTGGIDDPESATTTISICDDYSITAEFAPVAQLEGQTREVNCFILPGVTVTVYHGDVQIDSDVSDENGFYTLEVPMPGDYDVVASKEGFFTETRNVSVSESPTIVDFITDSGLIPDPTDMSYVLACISLWKFGEPLCQLTQSRVLAVISAWKSV